MKVIKMEMVEIDDYDKSSVSCYLSDDDLFYLMHILRYKGVGRGYLLNKLIVMFNKITGKES